MKSVEEAKLSNTKGANLDLRSLGDLRLAIEVGDRIVCPTYPLPTNPSWQLFEAFLKEKLHQNILKVCYRDEEGDDVCMSSDEEFFEALKVYKKHNKILMLHVTPNSTDAPLNFSSVDGDGFPKHTVSSENKIENTKTMPGPSKKEMKGPQRLDDVVLNIPKLAVVTKERSSSLKEPNTPPKWFTTYMEKFKGDISAEITKKVMHRMQKLMISGPQQGLKKSKADGDVINKEPTEKKPPVILTTHEIDEAVCSPYIIHNGIVCDNCGDIIIGIRYKCGNCAKYDLCEKCEAENTHDQYHVFVKIKRPSPGIGIKKKTGKMAPLLKDILYEGEAGSEKLHKDLVMEKGKRLLKRLEKQAQRLKKEQERYRQKFLDKETRYWDTTTNGHRHSHSPVYRYHHPYAAFPPKTSSHHPAPKEPEATPVQQPPNNPFEMLTLNATFLKDETVPDGTQMQPNTKFTKIWRMLNSGTKPWCSEIKLKCLWGTLGLRPLQNEVPVPHLQPGEEGIISVDFIAPPNPGYYDSHWRMSERGNERFGHRIWCSIVVEPPIILDVIQPSSLRLVDSVQDGRTEIKLLQDSENGEKEQLLVEEIKDNIVQIEDPPCSLSQDNSSDGLNIPLGDETQNEEQDFSVLPSLLPPLPLYATKPKHLHKDKDSSSKFLEDRSPPLVSYAATPNNTPFDMTPPKSPDLVKVEYSLPCSQNQTEDDDKEASILSEDSDFGGSLVNLSSSDSELDYVVVPMPACFNYLTPPVTIEDRVLPPSDFKVDENCNSSVTTATDTEEDVPAQLSASAPVQQKASVIDVISDSGVQCPNSASTLCPQPSHLSDSDEDNESKHTAKDEGESQCPKGVFVEAESGENLTAKDHSSCSNSFQHRSPECLPVPQVSAPQLTESGDDIIEEGRMPDLEDRYENRMGGRPQEHEVGKERILPILPEPIMSAAATMFNSACAMFSTLQENQRPKPQPHLFPQSVSNEYADSLDQLLEMGFCDRDLNLQLLRKHNGDVSNAVLELLVITDNNWYATRH